MHFIPFLIFIIFLSNISIQSKHNNKAKKMHKQLPKLIEAPALYEAIKSSHEHLRILDCTFLPKPRPYREFQQNFFGKFEEQVKRGEPNFKAAYDQFLEGHIPTSTHFNLGVATHLTEFEKFAYYPPKIFEQYAQLLGLNSTDHLVFYSRGPLGGMLFASRAYWLFKSYGHSGGLSLLDGGMDSWLQHKFPFDIGNETEPVFKGNRGDWKAKANPAKFYIELEEFTTADGKNLTGKEQFLDARPKGQFSGCEFAFDPTKPKPPGAHLPGAINIPSTELVDPETGMLISPKDLHDLVECTGLHVEDIKKGQTKPLVALCNAGMQASLLATALDVQLDLDNVRVYGGSMLEIQARAPQLISEKEENGKDEKACAAGKCGKKK